MAIDWSKLTSYLQQLPIVTGGRLILTMDDIKCITSTTAKLNYPVEWSADMAKDKSGVSAYRSIDNAGFDVVRIELSYSPVEYRNVVKFVEIEKVVKRKANNI